MISTFGILDEFKAIEALSSEIEFNEETGEVVDNTEIIKVMLDELEATKETKLDNIEYIKRDRKGSSEKLQAEIKRLTERKGAIDKKVEQLKGLQEMLLGSEGCKTDKFTFFYGTSQSVDIEDENEIPEAYLKVEFKVNKTEIAKALKGGGAVSGAKMVEKTSLRVR